MWFDWTDVDPVNDFFNQHAGDSSIGMNLGDSARTLSSIFWSIGPESNDQNLISCVAVMASSSGIFSEVVLIKQRLSLFAKRLWSDNDRCGQWHVSGECNVAR